MDKNKIQKVSDPIIRLADVHSMGVIGDPGCEGLQECGSGYYKHPPV